MKLSSFRELLLKKVEDNPDLSTLLAFAREDIIADKLIEVLEKMARATHKGDKANESVRHFVSTMDPESGPKMIGDAIGHHVSRYKAALKGNRPDLANRHAKRALEVMNLADTAQQHSGGKLHLDYVDIKPWERNYKTKKYDPADPKVQEGKYRAGDYVNKTKGLNVTNFTNKFDWLNKAPHDDATNRKEVSGHGHNKAYPFEQTRVNGKYIHIDDVDPKDLKGFEEHPLDHHPIMNHWQDSHEKRTPEQHAQYLDEASKYDESPHIEKFYQKHDDLEAQDPEAYTKRGDEPSAPVHDDIPGLDLGGGSQEAPVKSSQQAAPAKSGALEKPGHIDQGLWDMLDEGDRATLMSGGDK